MWSQAGCRHSRRHRPARQVSRYCGRAAGASVDEPRAHADQIWPAIAADDPWNLPQPMAPAAQLVNVGGRPAVRCEGWIADRPHRHRRARTRQPEPGLRLDGATRTGRDRWPRIGGRPPAREYTTAAITPAIITLTATPAATPRRRRRRRASRIRASGSVPASGGQLGGAGRAIFTACS